MAQLSPLSVTRAGTTLATASAAGGGDSFLNTGTEMLYVANGGVGSITVTIAVQTTVDGQAVPGRTVTVSNGVTKLIGPFPTPNYNDANGLVQISYSGVTSVTVAVIKPS